MQKKTIILSLVGLFAVVAVGGALALNSWLSRLLTKESLVRQLEAQWNCRAALRDLTVSLGSSPAHVELKGLVLTKRDADASAGTPLNSRKPVTGGIVTADELRLEVDLTELLFHRLHVKRLTLSGVHVDNRVTSEDGNELQNLFRKPLPPASAHPAAAAPASAGQPPSPSPSAPPSSIAGHEAPAPETKREDNKIVKRPAFQADELGLSVVIDEARLERGTFHEANHIVDTKTNISDLTLAVTKVDIDPRDLVHHDQCKLDLSARVQSQGRAKVDNAMQDVKIADFTFGSSGTVQPLDPATGTLAVVGAVEVDLKKGSIFGGTQTLGDLFGNSKAFKNMKGNFGLDVSEVKVGGQLQEDMKTKVVLNGSRVEFAKDAVLSFPDYTATLRATSWLNGAEDQQEMQLLLVPSEPLAKKILDVAKERVGEGLVKMAESMFNDGQGHFAFDLVSTGTLSKPKMELGGQAGALQKALKGLGGGLLKGLIK